MPRIKRYKPRQTQIELHSEGYSGFQRFGGWDEKTQALAPIKYSQLVEKHSGGDFAVLPYALDSITLAVEAGLIDTETFVDQAFASRHDFLAFCKDLEMAGDFWVNERHFYAFFEMFGSEEDLTTYPDIAATLERDYATGPAARITHARQ